MSFKRQINLLFGVHGVAWIIIGITQLFDNLVCEWIGIVALLCSAISLIIVLLSKKEKADERSKRNLRKAKLKVSTYMHSLFCVIMVILFGVSKWGELSNIVFSRVILSIFFVALGAENLLINLHYKALEKKSGLIAKR